MKNPHEKPTVPTEEETKRSKEEGGVEKEGIDPDLLKAKIQQKVRRRTWERIPEERGTNI